MKDVERLIYQMAAKDAAWPVLPIVMADVVTGEIVYCSRFAAATFGYDFEELEGQLVEVLAPDEVRTPHTAWRQDVFVPNTRLMGVGRQVRGKRKDGSLFPVHVGLTAMEVQGRRIGIAFVIDLSSVLPPSQTSIPVASVVPEIPLSSEGG